ncbi:hypothetical protein NG895_11930 [Aeoliella sp. ICT_H6.2]|uniref:Uncharacterized protein n=1 Tax=Aeoliella straminimaris TaxID=2954799 RepID=A0A9X2FAL7_9BACT|nr:hypothetical protein [Aeoliella straminimaris]MCO6044617.1 hypothetical protein [Aeoliella straminimaris]
MASENPYESPESGEPVGGPSVPRAPRWPVPSLGWLFSILWLTSVWILSGLAALWVSARFYRIWHPEDVEPMIEIGQGAIAILIVVWFLLGMAGTILLGYLERRLRRRGPKTSG